MAASRRDLGELYSTLQLDTDKWKAAIADVQKDARSLGKDLTNQGKQISAAISVPLAAAAGVAAKFAIDFNRSMADVASLIPKNTARVQELKAGIQDLAIASGKSTEELSRGAYQAISAYGDTADTVKILELSTKTATAGVSTTTEAINLLSAVTRGYGDASLEAQQKAADLALLTVRLGQTTFPELAGSIGKVIPLANTLKISQEELFAVMATLTGPLGSASEVSTQFKGILQSLMAPTESMTELFDKLGIASGKALIEQRGLGGAIDVIVASAEKSGIPLQKLISQVEGQTAALALSGAQAKDYQKKLQEMNRSIGTLDEAYLEQTRGINAVGFAFSQTKQAVIVALQIMGDAILETFGEVGISALESFNSTIVNLAKYFRDLEPSTRKAIVVFGALAAAIPPVGLAIGTALSFIGKLNPQLLLLTGTIAGGAALWTKYGDEITSFFQRNIGNFDDFQMGLSVLGEAFSDFGGWLAQIGALVSSAWGNISSEVSRISTEIVSEFEKLYSSSIGWISKLVQEIKIWLVDTFNSTIIKPFKDAIADVAGALEALYNKVADAGSFIFGATEEAVKPAVAATAIAAQATGEEVVKVFKTTVSEAGKYWNDLAARASSSLTSAGNAATKLGMETSNAAKSVSTGINPALEKTGKAAHDAAKGVELAGDSANKSKSKLDALRSKIESLNDKIQDLAGLNSPIESLTKRIADLLSSGKKGNELAVALSSIQKEYQGTEKELAKFDKALSEANKRVEEQTRRTNDLDKQIEKLSGVDKFPELTAQIQAAFGERSQLSAEQFAEKLKLIRDAFDDTEERAQAFSETLSKVESSSKEGGFFESIFGSLASGNTNDIIEGFSERLGQTAFDNLSSAVERALQDGFSSENLEATLKQLGASLGETIGAAVGGPAGAFVGKVWGEKIGNSFSKFGKDKQGTVEAVTTAVTFSPWVGEFVGNMFSDLGDADNQAREAMEHFLEDILGSNIVVGARDQFKGDWVSTFQDIAGEGQGAFEALGLAVTQMAGQSSELAVQMGLILAQSISGNLNEARFMVQELGLDSEKLNEIYINLGKTGEKSWLEVESALQQVNTLTGEGLVGIGDTTGAFQMLLDTGGKGIRAIQSLQAIGIEAAEAGGRSLDDLKSRLIASGQFTEEQINKLMAALQNRGVTSLEGLSEASDRTLGGIVADIDAAGIEWGEFGSKVDDAVVEIERFNEKLANIDRDLEVKIRLKYEELNKPPEIEGSALGDLFERGVKKFANGGIVDRATLFSFGGGSQIGVMGEAGNEAILPVERNSRGKLGVNAEGLGNQVHYHIDARGAEAGVELRILQALKQVQKNAVREAVQIVREFD